MATFDFCPDRYVPETLPPELGGTTMTTTSGWNFSARPTAPYQRRFKLKLFGLRWYLDGNNLYDHTTDRQFNARALERFYCDHQTWKPFDFTHQHIGAMTCRFFAAVSVPAAQPNSDGFIDPVELTLVEHNPGY